MQRNKRRRAHLVVRALTCLGVPWFSDDASRITESDKAPQLQLNKKAIACLPLSWLWEKCCYTMVFGGHPIGHHEDCVLSWQNGGVIVDKTPQLLKR